MAWYHIVMQQIYLDNNATTHPDPVVVDAIQKMLTDIWGNPSSLHRFGQMAKRELELAREKTASLIGAEPRDITFTSGGTESANLAIQGVLGLIDSENKAVVTSGIEHSTVRELVRELERRGRINAVWLNTDRGLITPEILTETLKANPGAALVSIQWANNETGLIQPIAELGRVCREREVIFHVDATQWVGKMPVDVSDYDALPVDLLTFSSHKFHGPKGCGCLWVRRGIGIQPLIIGGSQERKRRPGTENIIGVIGMGVAAELAQKWLKTQRRETQAKLRDDFEQMIQQYCPNVKINNADQSRLWSTSSIAFRGLEAEAILIALSERGVYASAGAACSSGSLEPSPVLKTLGLDDEDAHGTVRFSLSRETAREEVTAAAEIIIDVVRRLGKF